MAEQAPKEGAELAAHRVKMYQRKARKEREKLNPQLTETAQTDATLLGQLKAAQSNSRNILLREQVHEAISTGRVESIENQISARSALRLEALLIDPIKQHQKARRDKREISSIISNSDRYHASRIMTDNTWGQRLF